MGRKSKLTPAQWADISRRLLEGESASELGREYGITESTIRGHFERKGQKTTEVREVANMVVAAKHATNEAQKALEALPAEAQIAANGLAAKMMSIAIKVANGAESGAAVYEHFQAVAAVEARKVRAGNLSTEEAITAMRNVSALARVGNEANAGATAFMNAQRDAIKRQAEKDGDGLDGGLTPFRKIERTVVDPANPDA